MSSSEQQAKGIKGIQDGSGNELSVLTTIIAKHESSPGPLLPILHEVQNHLGYISAQSIATIAQSLNLSRAEVHGVVSFYHHFKTKPQGKHTLEVCRAESCQAMGGRELERYAQQRLGIDWGETSPNHSVNLEPVYCLGHCACSPAVRVGERMYGRMTPQRLANVMDELETVTVEVQSL